MSIDEKDVKKLWGLSAGRCNNPTCDYECIQLLTTGPTVIGEMAHVIAKAPSGPRGISKGGKDTYENLILLCPTHHTEVDKAPSDTFTSDVLLGWKKCHEAAVASALQSTVFLTAREIGQYIKRLLVENRTVWKTYGPESLVAQANPISNLCDIWTLRKLKTIVPNNRKIINAIRKNARLFNVESYEVACLFIEHAEGFERNCYERTEGVPRFPKEFEIMVDKYAQI